MSRPFLALAVALALLIVPPHVATAAPYCVPGQTPGFVFGFAQLKVELGETMGEPLECEHANPDNGDALQQTTTGLSFYRKSTNTPTFTNGWEHWALTSDGLVYWTGASIDPPGVVVPAPTPTPGTPLEAPPGDRFGVSLTANELNPRTPRALALATEAGIRWLRLGIYWSRVEPGRGRFDWRGYDAVVSTAQAEGLQMLGILGFSAPWSTSAPSVVPSGASREHYPPSDYSAWQEYVFQTVSRYKDDIHVWEIWNEPDLSGFWAGTPAQYARLLAVAYEAVKQADPNAQVVLGGLALSGRAEARAADFVQRVLDDPLYPAGQYFEVANFHQYGPLTAAQQRMDYLRGELTRAGAGGRPTWVTEVGYSSDPALQGVAGYRDGEAAQSRWLTDTLSLLLDQGADRLFWFTLYDDRTAGTDFARHGLLNTDLSPKQAYFTYRDFIASH